MRFERLYIRGFGRLRDLTLDFDPALTVVAGVNEAGKTTVKDCLLRMLFGFPEARFNTPRLRYQPIANPSIFGATLTYRLDSGRPYEIARDFAREDVPTNTIEADTGRPVSDLCGDRKASPGEAIFRISLPAYERAAVVSAGDFFRDDDSGVVGEIGEQLAAIVGSGADASAADAVERLRQFAREIGERGAGTPLGKAAADADAAKRGLERFQSDYRGFETRFAQQAALEETLADLRRRYDRCDSARSTAKLRAIQARLSAARNAKAEVDAAIGARSKVANGAAPPAEKRRAIDAAIQSWQLAEHSFTEASARNDGRQDDRAALQVALDAQTATLMEKRAALAQLEQAVARSEKAAAHDISDAEFAALERESDDVDVLESRERNFATKAAIARQQRRPALVTTLIAAAAAILAIAGGVVEHAVLLWAPGALLAAVTIALIASFVILTNRRTARIRSAELEADEARTEFDRAAAALGAHCRMAGCPDMAAARAAKTAHGELARLRDQVAAAAQAAALVADKRDAMLQHFADMTSLKTEADEWVEQRRSRAAAVTALLDDAGIAPAAFDQRLTLYRNATEAGEAAARADAHVAETQVALERILAGSTIEELEEEADRISGGGAAGGDAGEYADRDADDLVREHVAIDEAMRKKEQELEGVRSAITEFERTHRDSGSDLEETAALLASERDRLAAARRAAKIAYETIEKVKDAVHRDFTPRLNEALEASSSAITGRRYERVFADPATLELRVIAPENGQTVEGSTLSTGTIEQLQFALRAALAGILGSGERLPIIYDDALAHADDERLRSALAHAASLAHTGTQIVFFTQRGDIERIAASLDARILRLPNPI